VRKQVHPCGRFLAFTPPGPLQYSHGGGLLLTKGPHAAAQAGWSVGQQGQWARPSLAVPCLSPGERLLPFRALTVGRGLPREC
jgi:hypothetical protein